MESIPAALSSTVVLPEPREASRSPGVGAILVGGDEDRRLLLRGILTLEHHSVTYHGRGAEALADLAPPAGSGLLVLDLDSGSGPWAEGLSAALRLHPSLRALVLLPAGAGELEREAMQAGARATLRRPFTLRAFRDAIAEALAVDPPGPP